MGIKVTKPEVNIREKLNELDFDKVPFQKMPAGSVLQVVHDFGAADPETATTSTSFVATGTYATITPMLATSKILVTVQGGLLLCAAGTNGIAIATIYRNGSDEGCTEMRVRNDSNRGESPYSLSWLDTPNTTVSLTYKVYIRVSTSGTIQSSNHYPQSPRVTIMEIAQ